MSIIFKKKKTGKANNIAMRMYSTAEELTTWNILEKIGFLPWV